MQESFKSRLNNPVTRRRFLQRTLHASAALATISCGPVRGEDSDHDNRVNIDAADTILCKDALAGGVFVRTLRFADEHQVDYNQRWQQGWDGGLTADLSALTPSNLLMSNQYFFIRTTAPEHLLPVAQWRIRVHGLVQSDRFLSLEELQPLMAPRGSFVLECSGNKGAGFGLMSAANWEGVLIKDLLKLLLPTPQATHLLVSGSDLPAVPSKDSTRGASWIFSLQQLVEAGAFLATRMNGAALPPDHGAPVRLYVPGWYGCTAIKWVNELKFVRDNAPATAQMREFASRTHQRGVPDLARDYRAALADQAAMPVRIEQWRLDGATRYRIVGIVWGGQKVFDHPTLRFNPGEPFVPVDVCPPMKHNQPWTLWSHVWDPPGPGRYQMRARIDDWSIPTRRLDQGWYDREVKILDG